MRCKVRSEKTCSELYILRGPGTFHLISEPIGSLHMISRCDSVCIIWCEGTVADWLDFLREVQWFESHLGRRPFCTFCTMRGDVDDYSNDR